MRCDQPSLRGCASVACVAIALAGIAVPTAMAAHAAPHAALQAADELVGDFRAIRAAEAAMDRARIEEILRLADGKRRGEPRGLVAARAWNALQAVELRRAATTAAALVAAEDTIESSRDALIESLRGGGLDAARALQAELVLESAEDLLLRRLAAPATDAMLAVGLPLEAELVAATRVSAAVRARLVDGALAEPGDASRSFRVRVLRGLSALLEHDLARLAQKEDAARPAGDARARALAALDEAAASGVEAPQALRDVLALAQARSSSDPVRRAALLQTAAESDDDATALVAKIEAWRDAGLSGDAPRAGAGAELLAQLSLAAEVRARAEAGEGAASIAAATERWIDRAGRGSTEAAAQRIAAVLATIPVDETTSPTLVALRVLLPAGRSPAPPREALLAAARDARVGPVVAIRVAEALLRAGDADGAASLILASIERFDELPAARGALEIALEVRRLRALSAVSVRMAAADGAITQEDAALADALRIASSRFARDAAAPSWRLERALLGAEEASGGTAPSEAADAAPPWLVRALGAQEEIRAADAARARGDMQVAFARLDGALALLAPAADSVAAHTHAERRVALRAAWRWLELAASDDAPRDATTEAPAALALLATASPAVGAHARAVLPALTDRAALVLDLFPSREAAAPLEATLRLLARLAAATAHDGGDDRVCAAARAIADLLAGEHAAAEETARAALVRTADDRALLWALAESLRRAGTRESLDESFTRFRALAPVAREDRDTWWWRGQLGQLEVLAASIGERQASRADIVARVNQLSTLDPALGGGALRARFEKVRMRAEEPRQGQSTGESP
ncbi:MAG: hypothetical protein GC172_11200 [Phycisphaera sp.]|nr:hypothetical protein [Phycisphaera sp.]